MIIAFVLAVAIGILSQPILDTLGEALIEVFEEVEEAVHD